MTIAISRSLSTVAMLCVFAPVAALAQDDAATMPMSPANSEPGYVRVNPVPLGSVQIPSGAPVFDFPAGAATSRGQIAPDENAAGNASNTAGTGNGAGAGSSAAAIANNGAANPAIQGNGTVLGLDTVPTFTGAFAATGGPNAGTVYPYIIIGNDPRVGGRTTLQANITTVSLNLFNADGSFRLTIPFDDFESPTLASPIFQPSTYSSGYAQFTDAVQRAEFYAPSKSNWHTDLSPNVVNRISINIPRFVNVRFPDGSIKPVQNYYVGTAPNGDHFIELLDLFFNSRFFNAAVNDIVSGNYATDAFNLQLYPNTYLFSINNQGQFAGCCVLGFHTYFEEGGVVPQPRWVTAYASWISPGLFGAGFQDITALSHEVAEGFNDPFVNTAVPVWQFPGVPANSTQCQGNFETGDPVEVLANATFPVTLGKGKNAFTYHPQTEALLQWFTQGPASDAFNGDWSYPNETALTRSALPCPSGTPLNSATIKLAH